MEVLKLSSLEIKCLNRRWGRFRITDLSLTVKAGEYMMLLGPTGSGKTLLLETIAGFHKPETGAIHIDNTDITSWQPERRNIGYVPQNQSLFPNMTVQKNIEFGLKMHKIGDTEISKRVHEILNLIDIKNLSNRSPQSLSGGERQKVALARALVLRPKILLLDEPMSNIDTPTRSELMKNLGTIHKKLGVTIIHVTHNHEEAGYLGEKTGILFDGKIRQVGATEEVYERPASHEIARFLGFDNIYKVTRTSNESIKIGEKSLIHPAVNMKAEACGWRRENVKVSRENLTGFNVFKGVINDCRGVGATAQVTVDAGLTVIASKHDDIKVGDEVYIQIPADKIFLW